MNAIKLSVSIVACAKLKFNAYAKPSYSFIVCLGAGFMLIGMSACQSQSQTQAIESLPQSEINKLEKVISADMPHSNAEGLGKEIEKPRHHSHAFDTEIIQPVGVENSAKLQAQKMVESLKLGQARVAAQRRDKCPKLLTPSVESNQIVRHDELMRDNHCDYYLYPMQHDVISVKTNPDSIHATLVAPEVHDFSNGSYSVDNPDKHVVRLNYTGNEYPAGPIEYDVILTNQH